MINGGYILQPRCIGESRIAHCPPHFREIWFWILREANHKNTKVCDRGECIRSYRDMQEGLHWFVGWRKETYKKHHCEKAMKWLVKEHMIEARKTTRGMHIKVLNYDYYQNPVNYESDKESDKKATRKRQSSDTINKNVKNVENVKNIHREFIEFFNLKLQTKYQLTSKVISQINTRVDEGFTLEDFKVAIKNAMGDKYLMGKNTNKRRYLTPEYITRPDKLQDWLNSDEKGGEQWI